MKRFYKDYSTVPYIKSLEVEPYDPHTNVFSYPLDENDNYGSGETYGTCDQELDEMEINMDANGIIEVTKILIGEIAPYGSSYIDIKHYDNQEKLIELTEELMDILIKNSQYKDRSEYSMQRIGDRAYEVLSSIHKQIGEYL